MTHLPLSYAEMITDRPASLLSIPNYDRLSRPIAGICTEGIPDLLKLDIMMLEGALPHTMEISDLCPEGLGVQPNANVVKYYRDRKTLFQMVSVVANCAYFF